VWNPRARRPEKYYFGTWHDDPNGERALHDPQIGWLSRRDAIRAGVDNVRLSPATAAGMTLGELMNRFLTHKRAKAQAGELSLATLGDYLREVEAFVSFMKPLTPAGGLKPEHFSAYMLHLTDGRTLGRPSRKRVRAYVTAFLRHGAKNDWYTMPNTGTDWAAPPTDPAAMRQARARAGVADYSDRILTGEEIDKLLARANPTFKAMILLGINCGLGPADIGRLRWSMMDLDRRRLTFPRPKTGIERVGFLWKRTCTALRRVRTLKHNRNALEREGKAALVFITRKGLAYYREREVHAELEMNGSKVRKLKRIDVRNAVSITFGRLARDLDLAGVSFYRLRHSFRTVAKRARDREALDLMMGHKDSSIGRVYDHEFIGWGRIRRVALTVHRRLWPMVKPKEGRQPPKGRLRLAGGDAARPPATAE
jgi:integrase